MKIITKRPLRPRGKSDEKQQMTSREEIRAAYLNGPAHDVQVIPAIKDTLDPSEKRKLRVCAYCRVSTDEDNQAGSYELQVQHYTKLIQENPEWEFAGIFADKGISGTSMLHREQFLEMIRRCQAGEIDLIITKQINRFARNVLDSLNTIFMLRKLDPPVGVLFETEHLNTLDRTSDMVITVLSLVAQGESEQKSTSIKWAYKNRWKNGIGIYPTWTLLGYRGHGWEIDEDEANVIRAIYSLYLEGYSSGQIAEFLTKSGISTATGKDTWSSGTVLSILKNEKYCGDVLCQKTVTLDPLTHQSVRNRGIETQYFIEGHHDPIVEKKDWLKVQNILNERKYLERVRIRKRKPRAIVKGPLAGFIICDPLWDVDYAISVLIGPIADEDTAILSASADDQNFIVEE